MPWLLLLGFTIVAAFGPRPARAAEISEDVPVQPAVLAAALELGIDLEEARARFSAELIRTVYGANEKGHPVLDGLRRQVRMPSVSAEQPPTVPIPLPAAVWSSAVLGRSVSRENLLAAIVLDRRAALLCHGLAALDDETLAFLENHPRVLRSLYVRGASAFATSGPALRIRANRIVVPGGDEAIPLWETVVGARVADPERFAAMLFAQREGRLAYLYRTVEQLDEAHARFALGLWMSDASVRAARFVALADAASQGFGDWRIERTPFVKPQHDLSMLLMRIMVASSGAPAGPSGRAFWAEAFGVSTGSAVPGDAVDATWLVDAILGSNVIVRADRLDQLAFGQRVFGSIGAESLADVLTAVKNFPDQRMLMLGLERMGIRTPRVYAAAARLPAHLASQRSEHTFAAMTQLQGALALVANMKAVGSLTTESAESLVVSLVRSPPDTEGRYRGKVAGWLERELLPLLPEGTSLEARTIAALAGPPRGAASPRVEWEGQVYVVDLAFAERQRLEVVRERQRSYSLDASLGLGQLVERLLGPSLGAAAIAETHDQLSSWAETYAAELKRPAPDVMPPGVPRSPVADALVERAVRELESAAASGQVRHAASVGASLAELADAMLGETLITLAYAQAIGDPEGTALLARNVALRHDFGLGREAGSWARLAWAAPRQAFQPGIAWHVSGSAIGLDVALASMSLRRLDPDRIAKAPRLSPNDREAFSASMKVMATRQLSDASRDAVVQGIARGRERVNALIGDRAALDGIADVVGLDGWRRRAIRWTLDRDPARAPSMFSLSELLILGDGSNQPAAHAWGMSALDVQGCPCTRLIPTSAWGLLAGRPQAGLAATIVPDLNLRVAMMLAELGLPAILAGPVLSAALQDFADDVQPIDSNDWWALAQFAAEIPRQRFEDYVAAVAAVGGPLVVADVADTERP